MMSSRRLRLVAAGLLVPVVFAALIGQAARAAQPASFKLGLEKAAEGLKAPVDLTNAGDGSGRLFAVEKEGRIQIVRDGKVAAKPFLDIVDLVGSRGSEQGLLGLAFHPKYKDNGLFFVDYTNLSGDTVVARYKVTSDADLADPKSAKIILRIDQPYSNHNGGQVRFGPDGFLYIGMGDGGSGGDPLKNGQNLKALLGKLLRIDVDKGEPYGIPADNPFADGKQGRPEIWSYGWRNPWRFSWDRANGDLYIGDVGQNVYEEIDYEKAGSPGGLNYGWNIMEGLHCYPPSVTTCKQDGLVLPVAEYSHSDGISVTGGFVYRGKAFPRMQGVYFYADYGSSRIWALQRDTAGKWQSTEVGQAKVPVSSFGEDEAGEIYLLDYGGGGVYHLIDENK